MNADISARTGRVCPLQALGAGLVRVIGAAVVAVLTLSACGSSAQGPSEPESTPTPSSVLRRSLGLPTDTGPVALTVDDRGRLWVSNATAGTVTRLTPEADAIATRVRVGERPGRATWWSGALWVTLAGGDEVVRVDRDTQQVSDRIRVGASPTDIVAAYGILWVTSGEDSMLHRIDPETRLRLPSVRLNAPGDRVTAGGDAIWVSSPDQARVTRIDPRTLKVTSHAAGCSGPRGMLARDGLLWVACGGSSEVVAIDEGSGEVRQRISVEGRPDSLAAASDGHMWVSLHAGPSLALIDPRSARVLSRWAVGGAPLIPPTSSLRTTAPATPSTVPSFDVPDTQPVGLALLGPRVWLTSFEADSIYGVNVTPGGR